MEQLLNGACREGCQVARPAPARASATQRCCKPSVKRVEREREASRPGDGRNQRALARRSLALGVARRIGPPGQERSGHLVTHSQAFGFLAGEFLDSDFLDFAQLAGVGCKRGRATNH